MATPIGKSAPAVLVGKQRVISPKVDSQFKSKGLTPTPHQALAAASYIRHSETVPRGAEPTPPRLKLEMSRPAPTLVGLKPTPAEIHDALNTLLPADREWHLAQTLLSPVPRPRIPYSTKPHLELLLTHVQSAISTPEMAQRTQPDRLNTALILLARGLDHLEVSHSRFKELRSENLHVWELVDAINLTAAGRAPAK